MHYTRAVNNNATHISSSCACTHRIIYYNNIITYTFADGENAAAHTRTTTAANSALDFGGRDVALSPRGRSLLLRPLRNADAAIVRATATTATGTQRRANQQPPPPPPIFGRGGASAASLLEGGEGVSDCRRRREHTQENAPPTGPVCGGTDGAGDRRRGGVCVGRATAAAAAAEESRLASIAAETPPRTRRTQSCGSNRTTRARSPPNIYRTVRTHIAHARPGGKTRTL